MKPLTQDDFKPENISKNKEKAKKWDAVIRRYRMRKKTKVKTHTYA